MKKKDDSKKKKNNKNKKKNSFLKGVKNEMRKVTWPDKKDVIKYSIATIVFCIIIVLFFQLLDLGLSIVKGVFN